MLPNSSHVASQAPEWSLVAPPICFLPSLTTLVATTIIIISSTNTHASPFRTILHVAGATCLFAWKRVLCVLFSQPLVTIIVGIFLIATAVKFLRSRDGTAANAPENETHSKLPPLLLPCRTTHTRLIPKAHSLSYSYLFVGVPIGWRTSVGSSLSSDNDNKSTWFSVHDEDYLARGKHEEGLKGKLSAYLASQDLDPSKIASAYLVTAPRFLGWSFNPVSFWYLYNESSQLEYMILEVNNTFDERRMYLLNRGDPSSNGTKFKQGWKKDFHVSPFNDREGFYSLTAKDFFSTPDASRVDNTIVLKTPQGESKIVARVFSTADGIPASSLSRWQTLLFVSKWWWVGFMTNPRILLEARILWVKKLQLFYRPEVNVGSIGRNETREEIVYEKAFRRFLNALAEQAGVRVGYVPAAGSDRGKKVDFDSSQTEVAIIAKVEVEVLTPAFYAELIRSQDLLEIFDKRCFDPMDGEKMVHIDEAGIPRLRKALAEYQNTRESESTLSSDKPSSTVSGLNDCLRTGMSLPSCILIATLTWVRLGSIKQHFSRKSQLKSGDEARSFAKHVSQLYNKRMDLDEFQRASFTQLLADRIALGSTALLHFYGTTIRWAAIVRLAWRISGLL